MKIDIVGDIMIDRKVISRVIFAYDGGEDIEEYLSEAKIETYLRVNAVMRQELSDLRIIRFPWQYTRYPVFFAGNASPDLLVGVAAFWLDR